MPCEYVRQYYDVPAEIGRRVEVKGRPGVIADDRGNYIGVLFDDVKPGNIAIVHPTDGVSYLGMGGVRRLTRSQRRYRAYLESDWFDGTFFEFMKMHPEAGA